MPNLMTPEMAYEGYYAVQKETVESGGIFEGVNFKAISPDLIAAMQPTIFLPKAKEWLYLRI